MPTLASLVLKNQIYYWKKTLLVVAISGLILSVGIGSVIFIDHIKKLVDKPLQSLNTELILEDDSANKNASEVKTTGIILPFNLNSFSKAEVEIKLKSIPEIKEVSAALQFWQFDMNSTKNLAAVDINDPSVGLRKMDTLIMPGGKFFSDNSAQEAIIERHWAKIYGYDVGKTIDIQGHTLHIVGIVDFKDSSNLANSQIFVPYETALGMLGEKDEIANQAFISLNSASQMENVKSKIAQIFPTYSLVTKDNLFKNLSGLNKMVYQFGDYFVLATILFSLLLVGWTLRIYQLDFQNQREILKLLGWQKRKIYQWLAVDLAYIILLAMLLTGTISIIIYWQFLSA